MSRNCIHYYAQELPGDRAILMMDVVIDDEIQNDLSMATGSPAPLETIKQYERMIDLNPAIERVVGQKKRSRVTQNGKVGRKAKIMAALVDAGEELTVREISKAIDVTYSEARGCVTRLEEQQFIAETTGHTKYRKYIPTAAGLTHYGYGSQS